ncbi:serine aminopeptidase domain-containing protein [Plantactinospora soyae]|uniref:serine aminopeptidase domain-containing protein n=1 Tax=Plantactinospora soyae TaxID=1544732 RepID=UPI00178A0D01|nr:alpha/beta hydrolase [Plantactinospora soyae]
MANDRARYRAMEDRIFAHYRAGRHAEGAALARTAYADLPDWRADLAHMAACLLVKDGRPAEAYAEMAAALAAGAWWHRRILVEDDDLAPLRELPDFAELVATAHDRAVAAASQARPPLVRRPLGEPVGVLVALHGAGEDADDAAGAWASAVDVGWLLLAVESTQRNTPTYRSWPEHEVAVRDVEAALANLTPAERALPLVSAGFSAGGRVAIRWALAGPAVAFIAMAPAIDSEQVDASLAGAAVRRELSGHVVLGSEDGDVRDGALAAVATSREIGLVCVLDEVAGLGHAFPENFADRLPKLLASARNKGKEAGAPSAPVKSAD